MKGRSTPDEARVAIIYEKLAGETMTRGQWRINDRNFAQKIVHVENACLAVLDEIKALEACDSSDRERVAKTVQALKVEFRFLNTLQLRE